MTRKNKAFAMGIFLITLLILGSICSTMIFIVSKDNFASRQANSKIEGRLLANTASDQFFSNLRNDNMFLNNMIDVNKCSLLDNPALRCKGSQFWGYVDEFGILASCPPGYRVNCFQLTAETSQASGSLQVTASNILAAKLTIKTRTGCYGSLQKCRYTTYSQVFRELQYFDYLYYTSKTTLDPSFAIQPSSCITSLSASSRDPSCINVAFSGLNSNLYKDTINGPIYTSDDYFFICGSPEFTPNAKVYVAGSGTPSGTAFMSTSDPNHGNDIGCDSSSFITPSQTYVNSNVTKINLPGENSYNNALKAKNLESNSCPEFPDGSIITMQGSANSGTVVSNGSISCSIASSGIVAVNGNLSGISGTVGSRITLVANGSITITGDISYFHGRTENNRTDILGLNALGNSSANRASKIIITQCNCNRNIDAVMLSVNNAVSVQDWYIDQNFAAGTYYTLSLFGAIAGKYQPIFGSFNGVDGTLLSGYVKNFKYDSRLYDATIQPSYLISPDNPLWTRLALSEVASSSTP